MDLSDLSNLAKYSDTYKHLLNVIDIFSQYAWVVPAKDKTAISITSGSKSLFQNRKRITIQLDKGTEFVNATVQQGLKRQGENFIGLNPNVKGAVIERFNRSLKPKIYK